MNIKLKTLAAAFALFCSATTFAANTTWTWIGGTDVWNDKSNWSTSDNDATVGSGDIVIINDGAVTYPILTSDVTVSDFIFNEGWFSTNGYAFTSLNDITINSGNFACDTSLITANNIFLYGGELSIQGNRINVSGDVLIDGGLLNVLNTDAVIINNLELSSGILNLRDFNLSVAGDYLYEGGTIANPGTFAIDSLIVDFTGTYTLSFDWTILTSARFINGIINTSSNAMLIFDNNAIAVGASNASHVNGPVTRLVATTGNTTFDFPVGNSLYYAPLQISDFADESAGDRFVAQYFQSNAPYNKNSKDGSLDHVGSAEYWILDRLSAGTPTTDVRVGLGYNTTDRSGGIDNATQLRIARWDGTTWKDHGNASLSGNNNVGFFTSSARITSFSPFTFGSSTSLNPLPVTLINFKAVAAANQVKVSWSTTSEVNNDFFAVQKSTDGKSWSVIGIVDGVGNSSYMSNYSFMDNAPVKGVQYYRLLQTDVNGASVHSNIAVVNFQSDNFTAVTLYPNPAGNMVSVILSEPAENAGIKVFNSMGKMVMEVSGMSGNAFSIDMSTLNEDIYTIEIHHDNGVSISKVLKN